MKVTAPVKEEVEIAPSNLYEVTVTRAARVRTRTRCLSMRPTRRPQGKWSEAVSMWITSWITTVNEDGSDWEDDVEIQEVTLVEPDAEIQLDARVSGIPMVAFRAAGNEGRSRRKGGVGNGN